VAGDAEEHVAELLSSPDGRVVQRLLDGIRHSHRACAQPAAVWLAELKLEIEETTEWGVAQLVSRVCAEGWGKKRRNRLSRLCVRAVVEAWLPREKIAHEIRRPDGVLGVTGQIDSRIRDESPRQAHDHAEIFFRRRAPDFIQRRDVEGRVLDR